MHQRTILAGGCFWGKQDPILKQPGSSTLSGKGVDVACKPGGGRLH